MRVNERPKQRQIHFGNPQNVHTRVFVLCNHFGENPRGISLVHEQKQQLIIFGDQINDIHDVYK